MPSYWPWPSPSPVALNSISSNSRDLCVHRLQLQRQMTIRHGHVRQMPGPSPSKLPKRDQMESSTVRKPKIHKRTRMRSCWLLLLQIRSNPSASLCV